MDEQLTVAIEADTTGFEQALKVLEKQAASFGNTLTGAFKSALISGKSLEDVLRGLALNLAGNALNAGLAPLQGLLNQAGKALFSSLMPVTPFANGGALSGGAILAQPSYFPMTGGLGVAGEAGAEAILPLKRGSDGSLGVASGQGGAMRPVQVTVNISTPDAQSFKRSEAQVTAALTRAVIRGQRGN